MALAWPTNFPNALRFRVQPMWDSTIGDQSPWTGSKEVLPKYGQWHVEMSWLSMPIDEYLAATAFFSRSRGGQNLYQVPILASRARRGNKSGSVTLSGAHAAGALNLTITGGSGTLLAGDWVSLNTAAATPHAYLVVSSESGGIVGIEPGLRIALISGTAVTVTGVVSDTMELATPTPSFAEIEVQSPPVYSYPFAVEFVTAIRKNY